MRTVVLTALLLAAPAPPVKPPEENRPVEIDFAPLPGFGDNYRFRLIAEPEAGHTYNQVCSGNLPAPDVRSLFWESMESVGWKVRPVGETKLLIEGCRGGKFKKVEIKAEAGLKQEHVPTVKRLPPPREGK